MTAIQAPPTRSRPRPPRRRRRPWRRILALVVALLVAFALGLAVGRALEDGPQPGVTQTSVRTLEPLPQREAPQP